VRATGMTEAERIRFFAEAHRGHADLVRAIVSRIVPGHDAHDVMQNVWMAVFRYAHTYDAERGPLASWLAAIARREGQSFMRARLPRAGQAPLSEDVTVTPLRDEHELVEEVSTLLADLSGGDRETLMLWARGHSFDTVARLRGERRGVTTSRLARIASRVRAMRAERP
jgi:DNA-directed RNA polymerase specialized sigma24 family protein